jgi:hypothetical protein
VSHGVTVSCERYTMGFPVCCGIPSDVFASSSGFVHLYTLRFKEKEKSSAVVAKATVHKKRVYSGSSLLAELNFHAVSGLYKNFIGVSLSEFEFLIHLTGEEIAKKDTAFRKAISVKERLSLTLRFLAGGDWYVSLQYLFNISHFLPCILLFNFVKMHWVLCVPYYFFFLYISINSMTLSGVHSISQLQ